jgi:hypothetical protein
MIGIVGHTKTNLDPLHYKQAICGHVKSLLP